MRGVGNRVRVEDRGNIDDIQNIIDAELRRASEWICG